MNGILGFGEQIDAYPVRVLNERAVRAGAGIVFFFAMVAFMNAWLTGNFQPTRVFVVAFLVDFTIRIFVNPRYAPSLILGQWFVRKQQPEYVGAPQKRFAWAIGFVLALTMLYLVVINNLVGPLNLIVCAACLVLLFFETAFGICLGCKLYNLFNKEQAELCPGGVCEVAPEARLQLRWAQGAVVVVFVGAGRRHRLLGRRTRPARRVASGCRRGPPQARCRCRRGRALQGARLRQGHRSRAEVEAAQQLPVMRGENSPEVRRVRLAGLGGHHGDCGLRAVRRRCALKRRAAR